MNLDLDNPDGIGNLIVSPESRFTFEPCRGLLDGVTVIRGPAAALIQSRNGEE